MTHCFQGYLANVHWLECIFNIQFPHSETCNMVTQKQFSPVFLCMLSRSPAHHETTQQSPSIKSVWENKRSNYNFKSLNNTILKNISDKLLLKFLRVLCQMQCMFMTINHDRVWNAISMFILKSDTSFSNMQKTTSLTYFQALLIVIYTCAGVCEGSACLFQRSWRSWGLTTSYFFAYEVWSVVWTMKAYTTRSK